MVEMEESQTRFMVQRMNENLMDITEDLVRHQVSITSRDNGGFLMTGTEEGLVLSQRRFDRLKRKIITDTHTISSPGMPYYFTQETGKSFISSLEDKLNVVVHFEDPNKEPETMQMSQEINEHELQHGANSTETFEHLTSNHVDDSISDDKDEAAEATFETGKSPIHYVRFQ